MRQKIPFGLSVDGAVLIPCEYFALNHCPVADFFAGIFYLCWVPVPIAFGLWLYLKGDRKVYLRLRWCSCWLISSVLPAITSIPLLRPGMP